MSAWLNAFAPTSTPGKAHSVSENWKFLIPTALGHNPMPSMADTTTSFPLSGPKAEVEQDLGFGRVLSGQHGYRLLNRDGSYNVRRLHVSWFDRVFSYHTFLNISWSKFFALFAGMYLLLNATFAVLYLAVGPNQLAGDEVLHPFLRAFFFSVHTFATVGYGSISPVGVGANVIVTCETGVGLMLFSLITGLVFARFARPVAGIRYSKTALVAPYDGITALEFRVVNGRENQLFNLEAVVSLSRFEDTPNGRIRRFHQLKLERDKVAFFPLSWTVVHPITEKSPMYGWTQSMLLEAEAEVFILITAVDDTFSQTVNSRTSYTAKEIVCGRRFKLMYQQEGDHMLLDFEKLDETEVARLPDKVTA
jgi:inward rectifier potassium channel